MCWKRYHVFGITPLLHSANLGSEEEELLVKQDKLAQLKRLQNLNMHLLELLEKRDSENKLDMTKKSSNAKAIPAVCPHLSQNMGTSNILGAPFTGMGKVGKLSGLDNVDTQPLEDAVAKSEDRLRLIFI